MSFSSVWMVFRVFKEAISGSLSAGRDPEMCDPYATQFLSNNVNYNDLKKFSSDFKEVYNAPNETAALTELENMKEKWGKKYPYAISNWENNWEDVSSFFQFSNDIRRIMYTTNIIEGLNRQYRKVTKTKSVFPSDAALEKMLYLCQRKCSQEMDTEISELGSGVESADLSCMENGLPISVRKEKQEWICSKADHSRFLSIPSHLYYLPEFPYSIPEVGCGQSPQKAIIMMPYLSCKKNRK